MAAVESEDLYFEVLRIRSHYLLNAKNTDKVRELKLQLQGIMNIDVSLIELWKIENDSQYVMDETKTLAEYGYSIVNAKAEKPVPIGLRILGQDSRLMIERITAPPPPEEADHQENMPPAA